MSGPTTNGDAEDGAEQALVLAASGGREQVADDRQRDGEQRAGAEALDAAEEDQLPHGLRRPDRAEPIRKMAMPIRSIGRGRRGRTACRRTGTLIVLVSR